MAFYLIDFENIKNISGCDTLSENDTIVFFYSKSANSLTFKLHMDLQQSKAYKEYIRAESGGKNALDFQLSTYVGYLIAKYPDEKIYIISKDNGYANVLSFWNQKGQSVLELRKNIVEQNENEEKQDVKEAVSNNEKPRITDDEETIEAVLNKHVTKLSITKEQAKKVIEIVNKYKSKQTINNNLNKYFKDSAKVSDINKVIKPFLKNKSK